MGMACYSVSYNQHDQTCNHANPLLRVDSIPLDISLDINRDANLHALCGTLMLTTANLMHYYYIGDGNRGARGARAPQALRGGGAQGATITACAK